MSNIETNLAKIKTAVYGEEVRDAIHDAIHDCYEDGKAGDIDLVAREEIADVNNRISNIIAQSGTSDTEVVDARTDADGNAYTTLKDRLDTESTDLKSTLSDLGPDTTLTTAGMAADAKAVGDKINGAVHRYNWYDPSDTYLQVAADGTSARSGYTINSDGSITNASYTNTYGQILLKSTDESKLLNPGTYTISCRASIDESFTTGNRIIALRVGRSEDFKSASMKTERGGSINVTTNDFVGWVSATFTITEPEPFTFEITPVQQITDSIHPITFDNILINSGSFIYKYSTDLWKIEDEIAQATAETAQATAETAQATAETLVLFSDKGVCTINVSANTVSFAKSIIVFSPTEKTYLRTSAIAEMLGSAAEYDADTQIITITVPNECALVYDFKSKTMKIVPTVNHELGQIVLYASYYGNSSGYLWTKFNVDRVSDRYFMQAPLANVILTNTGRFEINRSTRTVAFAGSMYIDSIGNRTTISAASVAESIPTKAVYDSATNKVTITLENTDALVYSFATNSIAVKKITGVTDDLVLFVEYYGNDYGIIWDKYWRDKWIDESANNILTATDMFNAEPYTGTYDWQTPVVAYGALFKDKANVESFAFFTDPHTLGFADAERNETRMKNSFKRIQKVYNSTPCSFMVCGGDWLNNSTTKDEACYRLGYLKGISKNMFKDFYLVLGNHDTNYQGKADSESENWTGRLTDETVAAIMFRDTPTKKAYYSFDGSNSKCYVLDTGIEHNTMLAYDWEQVDWLAEQLITDDADHAVIFLHILMQSDAVQTNTSNFGFLVEAYNSHTTIVLNSKTYDFTGCTGHVDFWVAGHTHQDSTGTLGGIPYFITATNTYSSDVPLIDLVLVDYDSKTLNLIRVGGTGSDRTISFA